MIMILREAVGMMMTVVLFPGLVKGSMICSHGRAAFGAAEPAGGEAQKDLTMRASTGADD